MVACYGTTEYSEDMSHITLKIDGPEEKTIHYEYKCRGGGVKGATEVSAVIPEIETRVSMTASNADAEGYVKRDMHSHRCLPWDTEKQSQIRSSICNMAQLGKGKLNYRCPSCF